MRERERERCESGGTKASPLSVIGIILIVLPVVVMPVFVFVFFFDALFVIDVALLVSVVVLGFSVLAVGLLLTMET